MIGSSCCFTVVVSHNTERCALTRWRMSRTRNGCHPPLTGGSQRGLLPSLSPGDSAEAAGNWGGLLISCGARVSASCEPGGALRHSNLHFQPCFQLAIVKNLVPSSGAGHGTRRGRGQHLPHRRRAQSSSGASHHGSPGSRPLAGQRRRSQAHLVVPHREAKPARRPRRWCRGGGQPWRLMRSEADVARGRCSPTHLQARRF